MDMEKEYGYPRKLFCMGSKSIDETLSAYNLNDFDFYVAVYGYSGLGGYMDPLLSETAKKINGVPHVDLRTPQIDLKVQELLTKGIKRVAVISDKGIIMGEIYSRRNLPFQNMEINEYDPLWDKKYANIPGIIKTSPIKPPKIGINPTKVAKSCHHQNSDRRDLPLKLKKF